MVMRHRRAHSNDSAMRMNSTSTTVDRRPVQSLTAGVPKGLPEVVMVPGLGAPGYLLPWALAVTEWTCVTVLDVPGWRWGRPRACPATLQGIAAAISSWLEVTERQNVVLIGHSTGAQAAARAALLVPDRLAGLALAGPTFDPAARTIPTLLRRAVAAVAHEVPSEIPAVLPSYLHSGGLPLIRMLLSALPDRLEDLLPHVQVPVLVLTGERDGFAPPEWSRRLALLASAPCVVLPGAHNFCFPHPGAAALVLRSAVQDWTATGA
jgi:pimeloyl-ACP methyl ester carboxylesterase